MLITDTSVDNLMFLLLAGATLYHSLLRELSIGLPTQWAGQALVPLLVTAVTHRVVQMPARTRTTPRSSGSTIATHSAILKKSKYHTYTCSSCKAIQQDTFVYGLHMKYPKEKDPYSFTCCPTLLIYFNKIYM